MEYGILFSAPMVRAILAGRKSVTRRMSKQWLKRKCGDVLWVRETWGIINAWPDDVQYQYIRNGGPWRPNEMAYRADEPQGDYCWRSSLHMPRWASRITLEVTEDAREEQLQDITEEEAMREGFYQAVHESEHGVGQDVIGWFAGMWRSLHDKPGECWDDNPTVVRIPVRRII